MNVLEKSVSDLAAALENLESRIDERTEGGVVNDEEVIAARRQAKAALEQTAKARADVSEAIEDVKALLESGSKGA